MKKDIFDIIFDLPLVRIFRPIYIKYKSVLLYLFFGVVTTVVNYIVYIFLINCLNLHELIANIFAWIVAVLVAYITNRKYVFINHDKNIIRELALFGSARISTLVMEETIIAVFVSYLGYNKYVVKLMANILVIIANYFLSKLFVFKKRP